MYDFAHTLGLLWVTGFMTFVMGAVLVALHNMWCRDWRVIVTLLSWLTAIKGAVIMVIPQTMMTFIHDISVRSFPGVWWGIRDRSGAHPALAQFLRPQA
jgi:hypothetical protein